MPACHHGRGRRRRTRPQTLPTDRSIPPVIITAACPSTTIPTNERLRVSLSRLSTLAKLGAKIDSATHHDQISAPMMPVSRDWSSQETKLGHAETSARRVVLIDAAQRQVLLIHPVTGVSPRSSPRMRGFCAREAVEGQSRSDRPSTRRSPVAFPPARE